MVTQAYLDAITGGLSRTSAMPCPSYSIPAGYCQTGRRLAASAPNSACAHCYACGGRYGFANVQNALGRRYQCLTAALESTAARDRYVVAMADSITRAGRDVFRWHDSGDLQSAAHFAVIAAVCDATPHVRHWLPTRELAYVPRVYPDNLTVRYSLPVIDGRPPARHRLPLATIHSSQDTLRPDAFECRKPYQGNACKACRACWSRDVPLVSYALH
jgi:hypothetical protein